MATLADINSRVFAELDAVRDHLELADVHREVVSTLNVRAAMTRAGDTNTLLSVTPAFSATQLENDISAYIHKGTPAWVELETQDGFFEAVRIINYAQLNDYRTAGTFACAFYGLDNPNEVPAMMLAFTFPPTVPVRVYYDRDTVASGLNDEAALPNHVIDLVITETVNGLIPKLKLKISTELRRDEAGRQDVQLILNGLDGLMVYNKIEKIPKLEALWNVWAFRSRDAQTSFTKPTPSGRRMYGGGFFR